LTDVLGSVRDILGSTGTLLDHKDFGVWGNLTNETNPSAGDRYGFTGREWDAESDLQYNRARWYDPSTGRWMSQDPLGFDAGDSNLYRYVSNSPVANLDPSGKVIFTSSRSTAQDLADWFQGKAAGPFAGIKSPEIQVTVVQAATNLYFLVPATQVQMADAKEKASSGEWKGNLWVNDLVSLKTNIICSWKQNPNGRFKGWDLMYEPYDIPSNDSGDSVSIYSRPIEGAAGTILNTLLVGLVPSCGGIAIYFPHRFVGVTNRDGDVTATYSYDGDWHNTEAPDTKYVNWWRRCSAYYQAASNVSGVHVKVAYYFTHSNDGLSPLKCDCCWTRSEMLMWEAHKLAGAEFQINNLGSTLILYPDGTSKTLSDVTDGPVAIP
jgi:RHS repeat-associated protein